MPIMGMCTARAVSYTMRRAMGLMAGPDNPPVTLLNRGRRSSASIAMARNVFTRLTASAPASAATRAMCAIEVTLGVSFTISGLAARCLGAAHQVLQRPRIRPKSHPAGVHVRARHVQLVGRNPVRFVQPLDHSDVLAHRVPEDIHNHLALRIPLHGRQLPRNKVLHAHVLQPDGVQHSCRRLHHARRGVARHRLQRDPLGDDSAQPLQRNNLFKFNAVAKRAAGGNHRIHQLHSGQRDFHVGFHLAAIFLRSLAHLPVSALNRLPASLKFMIPARPAAASLSFAQTERPFGSAEGPRSQAEC